MAKDYYSDGEESAAGDTPPPKNETPTALLPKSFFPDGDPQPGKTCEVRVARVHDDQVEVEYIGAEKEEEPPMEAEVPDGAATGEAGMAEMMG